MESAMYFIIIIRAGNFLEDEAWLVAETNANSPENRNSDGNFELAYEILAPTLCLEIPDILSRRYERIIPNHLFNFKVHYC